jgi:hypothetical protein
MSLVFKDRVKETTSTTGTGSFTLAGAEQGFQSFAAVGDGEQTYYAVADPVTGDFEVGLGTYSTTGPTLSRDEVFSSSNSGSLVNFGAGDKEIFVTYPAGKAVSGSEGLIINSSTINQEFEIPAGYNALSAGPITVEDGVDITVSTGARWVVV